MGALLGFGLLLAGVAAYVVGKQGDAKADGRSARKYGPPFRTAAVAVLLFYVSAALAFVLTVLQFDLAAAAPVAPGQAGVAIGGFDGGVGTDGQAFSTTLARSLRREIQASHGLRATLVVVSAPAITTAAQAAEYAAANGVQWVVWGRVAGDGRDAFVPSVMVLEPPSWQLRYGDVPAPHDAPLTGDHGVALAETAPSDTAGLVDYLVGLAHLGRNNYRQAAGALGRAVAESPRLPRSLAVFQLALGRAYARLGEVSAARSAYQAALQANPAGGAAYIGLGNLEYEQGNCNAALDNYARAVDLAPQLAVSWYSRGNAYYCQKRYDEAASDYQAAVRLTPVGDDSASVYHLVLGATLCQAGRPAEGMAQLARAQERNLVRSAEAETAGCVTLAQAAEAAPPARLPAVTPAPTPTARPPSLSSLLSGFSLGLGSRKPAATQEPPATHAGRLAHAGRFAAAVCASNRQAGAGCGRHPDGHLPCVSGAGADRHPRAPGRSDVPARGAKPDWFAVLRAHPAGHRDAGPNRAAAYRDRGSSVARAHLAPNPDAGAKSDCCSTADVDPRADRDRATDRHSGVADGHSGIADRDGAAADRYSGPADGDGGAHANPAAARHAHPGPGAAANPDAAARQPKAAEASHEDAEALSDRATEATPRRVAATRAWPAPSGHSSRGARGPRRR